jgi:hypothetical protein
MEVLNLRGFMKYSNKLLKDTQYITTVLRVLFNQQEAASTPGFSQVSACLL